MKVWEVTSGRCVMKVEGCHGDQELTALAVDSEGSRILTGSHDGAIKARIRSLLAMSHALILPCAAGVGEPDGAAVAEPGHHWWLRGGPHTAHAREAEVPGHGVEQGHLSL